LTVSFGGKSAVIPGPLGSFTDEMDLDELNDIDSPTAYSVGVEDSDSGVRRGHLEVASATETHSDDRIAPGGTLPAHPGLNEHPMNEAALKTHHAEAPTTDRADQSQTPVPPASPPKLVVLRGLKINVEYPVYEGRNTIGRFADKPVDIDLLIQESVEQIWCSRQHAAIAYQSGTVSIEDLNSLNGTWLNGIRVHPGQPRQLKAGDIVQVGTVQMKLVMG
jgi:hypothetical protein